LDFSSRRYDDIETVATPILARRLQDAGFPQGGKGDVIHDWVTRTDDGHGFNYYSPTLEDLINECGDDFDLLTRNERGLWVAKSRIKHAAHGSTAKEAVALLWLVLNKKV
jgi:hypothetical protein